MPSNFPPDGYVRLTANMEVALHQKLKQASVTARCTMTRILEQLIRDHLDDIMRGGLK